MERKRGSGRLKGREIEICSRKAVVSMFVSERGRSVDNGVMYFGARDPALNQCSIQIDKETQIVTTKYD